MVAMPTDAIHMTPGAAAAIASAANRITVVRARQLAAGSDTTHGEAVRVALEDAYRQIAERATQGHRDAYGLFGPWGRYRHPPEAVVDAWTALQMDGYGVKFIHPFARFASAEEMDLGDRAWW